VKSPPSRRNSSTYPERAVIEGLVIPMAAQPKIFSFFKRLGGVTTPTTRNTSMRRTLSWCFVFWDLRRVIVVDLYAVALERLPAGASILSKRAKLRFYRRPRISVVHVLLYEGGGRPLVDIAQGGRLKRSVEQWRELFPLQRIRIGRSARAVEKAP
jgi:hypothetical protein